MKNWKKACTVIYGYSYIQKNHIYAHNYVHIGQFPQDGENGQNVAFCSFFWSSTVTKRFDFFLLRCYCREPDYHLGDYPYNVHGNLKWNTKSHGRQQCWIVLMQLCMKYADVTDDQYIAGGEILPPQDNMLEQPQICERESDLTWIDLVSYPLLGRGGNIKIDQFLRPSNCREGI